MSVRQSKNTSGTSSLHRSLRAWLEEFMANDSHELLPSERELMVAHGISRTTVRRAIQSLVQDGLVLPVHGKGNRILRKPHGAGGKVLLLLPEQAGRYQIEAFETLLGALADAEMQALCRIVRQGESLSLVAEGALAEVDGVILGDRASEDKDLYCILQRSGKKFAVLRHKPTVFPYPYAVEDIEDAFRQLVLYLAKLGHRKIACVTILHDKIRIAGLRRGFEEAGLKLDPALLVDSYGRMEAGFISASKLLETKRAFTAVITHNDECALGVMHRFMLAGIRIPGDVSITGYDNLQESAGYPIPLTSCGGDLPTLCNTIVKYISAAPQSSSPHLVLPVKICPRDSVNRIRRAGCS